MHHVYCPCCGRPLAPLDDHGIERRHCVACGHVQYRNPTVGVAVVLVVNGRVLLARRRGRQAGAWCIPCGHLEWDEDVREGAAREFFEETGLAVSVGPVFGVHSNFHDPERHTVGVWFTGTPTGGRPRPGSDVETLGWFSPCAPPENLAFPTDRLVLERLCRETSCGRD